MTYIEKFNLRVDRDFASFLDAEVLPGTGVLPDRFWRGFCELVDEFGSRNRGYLAKRAELKTLIDAWHISHRDQNFDAPAYKTFLQDIGYLERVGDPFHIETTDVDPEIALVPGPQLVVPIMNARYALNAANARYGSLYDTLYGTDAMGDAPSGSGYNAERGKRVVEFARRFLDETFPVQGGSHAQATRYWVEDGKLLINGQELCDPAAFVGYRNDPRAPEGILLRNNGLHIEILFDPDHPMGKQDQANMADVVLESAISAIMDCEDSVAAVDAQDKILCYSNWLGLMKGNLVTKLEKNGKTLTRRLLPDRKYLSPTGEAFSLKGRALMLIRNVGHLMTTHVVRDRDGNEIGEGLLDAICTTLIAIHDLNRDGGNSVHGSIYVVKPKMHGPAEVAFASEIFDRVENILGLPRYTVKLGIMDEERRTSVNLAECIRAAKHRVAFINTGFLDRTGDEINTSMEAGPFLRKGDIKTQPWIGAYEDQNVDVGLACGFQGKAQIGKGMWAIPARMADMLDQKIAHPQSGATCSWVPSPTAATLHAMHYHKVDVHQRQQDLAKGGVRASVDTILQIPLAAQHSWSQAEIISEVENNAQGILGYVVRWVDQGIGCSTVPDINNVGLMEDRATCRISSQHIANWLHHGIVGRDEVMEIMKRMAFVVDAQNSGDPAYRPMAPDFIGTAFRAACDLVFLGAVQPSGYTEPVLHACRLIRKHAESESGR